MHQRQARLYNRHHQPMLLSPHNRFWLSGFYGCSWQKMISSHLTGRIETIEIVNRNGGTKNGLQNGWLL